MTAFDTIFPEQRLGGRKFFNWRSHADLDEATSAFARAIIDSGAPLFSLNNRLYTYKQNRMGRGDQIYSPDVIGLKAIINEFVADRRGTITTESGATKVVVTTSNFVFPDSPDPSKEPTLDVLKHMLLIDLPAIAPPLDLPPALQNQVA